MGWNKNEKERENKKARIAVVDTYGGGVHIFFVGQQQQRLDHESASKKSPTGHQVNTARCVKTATPCLKRLTKEPQEPGITVVLSSLWTGWLQLRVGLVSIHLQTSELELLVYSVISKSVPWQLTTVWQVFSPMTMTSPTGSVSLAT